MTGTPWRRHARIAAVLVASASAAASAQPPAPLTLDAAVREALANSPDLQSPLDRVATADIQLRLARAAFMPKVTPSVGLGADPIGGNMRSGGVSVSKLLPSGTQTYASFTSYAFGVDAARQRDAGYTVGISQPLLRGAGLTAREPLTAASRDVTSARRALTAARETLLVRVSTAYIDALRADALVAIAHDAARRAAAFKASSEARAAVGLATELDVLRAGLMETEAASRVAAQEQSAADAREALAVLIGRAPDPALCLAGAQQPLTSAGPLPSSLDILVTHALSTRPEVTDARDRIVDAKRTADVARWNLLPPVSVDASFTRRGLGMPNGDAFNALVGGWHVSINTAYGLDRSTERAAAETAQLQVGAAQRNAGALEQQISAEVRRLHRAWAAARAAVTLREQALGLAEREREIATLRVERGLATSLDVLSAESAVLNAETTLAGARLDCLVDEIALRRASGFLTIGGA